MDEMFMEFVWELLSDKLAHLEEKLEQLDDPEDMFALTLDDEFIHEIFTPPVVYSKSYTDAEEARLDGNALYKSGSLMAALMSYDQSILLSPHPELEIQNECDPQDPDSANSCPKPKCSEEEMKKYKTLGLAYANRSAVFLSLKKYDSCLVDIDLAIKYGYPQNMRTKLEKRREKCVKEKEESGGIRESPGSVSLNNKVPPTLKEVNPSIPCFSSALEVAYSNSKGRHVIASRDILPGEMIAVERSYCSDVHSSMTKPYCPVCLLPPQNKIPCPSCPLTYFCSESYRAKGLNEHLKYCKTSFLMEALGVDDDSLASMAMKLLAATTFAKLKEMEPILKKETKDLHPNNLGFDRNGKFSSSDYRSVYHMASLGIKRRESVLKYCMAAFTITMMLHQSRDFFVSKEGLLFRPKREDLILTGAALLRHMLYVPEGLFLYDIKVGSVDVKNPKDIIALGIYPTLSLMRRSCDASADSFNMGHVKIVRAIFPIAAGQEVLLSFGIAWHHRWAVLWSADAKCACQTCEEFWPILPFIPEDIAFSCLRCKDKVSQETMWMCLGCGFNYSKRGKKWKKNSVIRKWWSMVDQVNRGLKDFEQISKRLSKGQAVAKTDYEKVCSFAILTKKHLKEPSMIFIDVRNALHWFFYREM